MIKAEIIGNLGADAEVKESNGSKFVTFRVAHTDKWSGADGSEHKQTTWVDVTLSDINSKVLPYLKAGVKVFVRGNVSLRVYSSKKDRCMKAGLTINAWEIELCGGASDEIPRQIVDPADGKVYDVQKYFWIDKETKGMKKDDLCEMTDAHGGRYAMNSAGFVARVPENLEEEEESK